MNLVLWLVQAVLAALFVFAGVMKFVMPVAEMTKQMPMPGLFLHFIGLAEALGGLGLVLPGLLRIRTGLTPLAAAGLVPIMVGATVITLRIAPPAQAVFPGVVGLLAAFVAWGRWRLSPLRGRG
jgi:uncharacterized membrane protein YphA (DoxX/SURF4 family)